MKAYIVRNNSLEIGEPKLVLSRETTVIPGKVPGSDGAEVRLLS